MVVLLLLVHMGVLVHLLVLLSMGVRMTLLLLLCVLRCVLLRLACILLVLSMRVNVSVSGQRYMLLCLFMSRGSMMSSCIIVRLIMLQENSSTAGRKRGGKVSTGLK
jgi:hypothetical protein